MRTIDPIDPHCPNFFNKNNPHFREFHTTLEGLFRKLRREGIGSGKMSAEPFTKEDEQLLIEKHIIGADSAILSVWGG